MAWFGPATSSGRSYAFRVERFLVRLHARSRRLPIGRSVGTGSNTGMDPRHHIIRDPLPPSPPAATPGVPTWPGCRTASGTSRGQTAGAGVSVVLVLRTRVGTSHLTVQVCTASVT